jgi:hypothetical protein
MPRQELRLHGSVAPDGLGGGAAAQRLGPRCRSAEVGAAATAKRSATQPGPPLPEVHGGDSDRRLICLTR